MKKFRITYRHEIVVLAEDKEKAKKRMMDIDLGDLNTEKINGQIYHHDWVEDISFEVEDGNFWKEV